MWLLATVLDSADTEYFYYCTAFHWMTLYWSISSSLRVGTMLNLLLHVQTLARRLEVNEGLRKWMKLNYDQGLWLVCLNSQGPGFKKYINANFQSPSNIPKFIKSTNFRIEAGRMVWIGSCTPALIVLLKCIFQRWWSLEQSESERNGEWRIP